MSNDLDYRGIDEALALSNTKSSDELDAMAAEQRRKDRWRPILSLTGTIGMLAGWFVPWSFWSAYVSLFYAVLLMSIPGMFLVFSNRIVSKRARIISLAQHLKRQVEPE